jgi:hypothetical protein
MKFEVSTHLLENNKLIMNHCIEYYWRPSIYYLMNLCHAKYIALKRCFITLRFRIGENHSLMHVEEFIQCGSLKPIIILFPMIARNHYQLINIEIYWLKSYNEKQYRISRKLRKVLIKIKELLWMRQQSFLQVGNLL